MKKVCFIALIVFSSVIVGSGVPQNSSQLPNVKAQTDLVLVPVIVQKGGAHVAGLQKSDFTLLQDGQPQTIAVFEEVHAPLPSAKVEMAANQFTNRKAASDAQQRMTVIALDLINTAPMDQTYLKQELRKFLSNAARTTEPYALLAITDKGVTVLQDFTTDIGAINAAVENTQTSLNGRAAPGKLDNAYLDATPCVESFGSTCGGGHTFGNAGKADLAIWQDMYKMAESYEVFMDRTTRLNTLGALVQIAQYLSGFPGRKTLVWAGSGIPYTGGMHRMMYGGTSMAAREGGSMGTLQQPATYTTFNPQIANESMDDNMRTLQLLNSASVSVYPLDARHNPNTSFAAFDTARSDAAAGNGGFSGEKGRVQADDQDRITTFQQFAANTGGKACFNRTDLANCLNEFAGDSHDYYMLGYYPDKKSKPGWHPLSVKLTQKADLRYRKGFIYSDTPPAKDSAADFKLAMLSPLPYTTLPFSGQFSIADASGGKRLVKFDLAIPTGVLDLGDHGTALNFDVVAIARNTEGREAGKFAQRVNRTLQPAQAQVVQAEGIRYGGKLELPPGVYGVWFAIRDNSSGKIGSAITKVNLK